MKSRNSRIKQWLKRFAILVALKRAIWQRLENTHPTQILADRDYFRKRFAHSKNLGSLSFDKGVVVGRFRDTPFLLNIRPQNYIESRIYLDGIWEPHIAELIASFLSGPNCAVIDVGANIGATSIPLAKHFTGVEFILFEPHPGVYKDLRNNISFNRLSNVSAHNIAITSHAESTLPFYAQRNANNFGLSSFSLNHDIGDYDIIQVTCKPLDEAIESTFEIKVMKIDTQGHELNVLLSAEKLIFKHRPVVLFEFESEYFANGDKEAEAKAKILHFFQRHNYELYMIDHDRSFLPRLTLEGYFRGDILALPLHAS